MREERSCVRLNKLCPAADPGDCLSVVFVRVVELRFQRRALRLCL